MKRPNWVDHIVVHCSATPVSMDIGATEIDEWHKKRGFDRIGYNYVIRRDGTLEIGRPEGEELAHAEGFNKRAIALCLVGGVTENQRPEANFTREQWRALRVMLDYLTIKYRGAAVIGHRDLPNVAKDCPCFDVRQWWQSGEIINPRKP